MIPRAARASCTLLAPARWPAPTATNTEDETAPTPLPPAAGTLWARMRTEVLGGQLLDITNEASADETVDAAYRVMKYKTAAYTVARPLQIGAALGVPADPPV